MKIEPPAICALKKSVLIILAAKMLMMIKNKMMLNLSLEIEITNKIGHKQFSIGCYIGH